GGHVPGRGPAAASFPLATRMKLALEFVESVQALFVSLLEFGQVLCVGLDPVLRDGIGLDAPECRALLFQLLLLLRNLFGQRALFILVRLQLICETLLLLAAPAFAE